MARSCGTRNSRGLGLPAEKSADIEPISTLPKPIASHRGMPRPFLFPTGGKSDWMSEIDTGGLHGEGGVIETEQTSQPRTKPWRIAYAPPR